MFVPCDQFDRFLDRLHRRLFIYRMMESAGVGALFGCAASIPIIGLMFWRGQTAMLAPTLILISLGAASGIFWRLRHRPTRMHAAHEADRQLLLYDLLSSALSVRHSDDPWAHSVLAMAQHRCAGLSPGVVVLHRLGVRAWGGIGLALALAMSLTMLGVDPKTLAARPMGSSPSEQTDPAHATTSTPGTSATPLPTDEQPDGAIAETPRGDAASATGQSAGVDGHRPGAGDRQASSSDALRAPPPAAAGSTGSDAGASIASGGIIALADGAIGAANGTLGAPRRRSDRPAWESSTWENDRLRASQQMQNGQIPDAYGELVRDYFRR